MDSTLPPQHLLAAQSLAEDPRIAQAKKLIREAITDHQKGLKAIRPANPLLKEQYAKMLANYGDLRGAKLMFPYLGSGMGKGALVELADGSVKYDFITGIGVHYLGHLHPDIVNAGIDAALSDTVMQGNLQQNTDSVDLADLLVKKSKVLNHCFFTSTGAMANENALKLIFQKKFPANRLLAFDRCFMGRTLAMSQISDRPNYREGLPINLFVDYLPFYDPTDPEGSTTRTVNVLKKHLERYPKQYAAMCLELIQGDGGFYAAPREFFLEIIQILKEHQIAVFIDEVQTFARTQELFAFQTLGLDQYVDLVSIGKLSQVCATLFTEEFKPRPGLLSQTFTSSTSSIKAGKAIIHYLLANGFFGSEGKINQFSRYFIKKLEELAKRFPDLIEGPYGSGGMIAFTAFKGDSQKIMKFLLELFDAGVIAFSTGYKPTRVRFLAPIGAISYEEIDQVMAIVEDVLKRQH